MKTGKRKIDKQTNKQTNESNRSTRPDVLHSFQISLSLFVSKVEHKSFGTESKLNLEIPKQRKINKVRLSCKSNSSGSRSNSQNFRIDECTSCFVFIYSVRHFFYSLTANGINQHSSLSVFGCVFMLLLLLFFHFIFCDFFGLLFNFFVVIVDSFESFALRLTVWLSFNVIVIWAWLCDNQAAPNL